MTGLVTFKLTEGRFPSPLVIFQSGFSKEHRSAAHRVAAPCISLGVECIKPNLYNVQVEIIFSTLNTADLGDDSGQGHAPTSRERAARTDGAER